MEIIIGKTAGFCYGVERAVNGAKKQIEENNIYCLGELVHNAQVVNELENNGMKIIDNIDDINEEKSKVIIRAHGIKKDIYDKAKQKNIELIDYTCPNVIKIHKIAEEYKKEGYYIFVIGTKLHPETIGTVSYCGNNYSIIEESKDIVSGIERLEQTGITNLLIIVQTTFSKKKFELLIDEIKNNLRKDINLVIKNTICYATEQRQKETEKISKEVDYMIVIGGKNSSNTKKLYEIAKNNCKSILIETVKELKIEEIRKFNKIGIMAGASTPKNNIDEVVNILKEEI